MRHVIASLGFDTVEVEGSMSITAYLHKDTNLREGPGSDYPIRANVGKNRGVEILDKKSEWPWVKVRVSQGDHKGKLGWMHSDNLDMDR